MHPGTHKDTLVYMGVLGGFIGIVTYQMCLLIQNMEMAQRNPFIMFTLALPLFWIFFTVGKNSEFKDKQIELLALWSAGLASFFACALYVSFVFSGNPTHTLIYMFIVKLIAIPYALVRIDKGVWAADYQKLHDFAWDRPLAFAFGLQLLFIVALLLSLWGGLFYGLGIKEFATAFSNPYFIAAVTGGIITVGILLAHMQNKIINSSIQFLDMTAFFVSPVLAVMAGLFVAMLPLTAANFLLKAEMISVGLLCLAVASIVCINCVVRIEVRPDMSRIVILSAKALCVTLPFIVTLAAIPIIQDAYNYGLSPNRINGLIFVFLPCYMAWPTLQPLYVGVLWRGTQPSGRPIYAYRY